MTKVLVVDDSALMRRVLGEIFRQAGFEVAFAKDGVEALEQTHAFAPDVVTLDVEMPRMDGLAALDRIMVERPCPVVMVSSLTGEGAQATLQALELGAVDFVQKPDGTVSLAIDELAPVLIETVQAAARARVRQSHRLAERLRVGRASRLTSSPARPTRSRVATAIGNGIEGMVVIGASTGGPPALDAVLSVLSEDFPWAVLVAQHMPATFTGSLATRLDQFCALPVLEVTRPTPILPGRIHIARGGADMIVSRRAEGLVALPAPASRDHRWHPSVDRLMASAMEHMPAERLVGVLMTGMGDDGAKTMTALRAAGGRTIAEAEETAVVWGMPGELVKAGGAVAIEPLDTIGDRLIRMVGP